VSITMHDLFAGAGGSSTGGISVPGVAVRAAMNHWPKAVEVHNANHPDAAHICADISQYDPRRIPTADLLWASPECTNHSQAKGRKRVDLGQPDLFGETLPDEAAERSRATMWDVPRFTEVHRYQAIVVENVVDAAKWTPFRQWLTVMDAYGYDHQIVWLNSMHAQAGGLPAPQSRDRMYVVFWRKGNRRPDLEAMQRPRAWCSRRQTVVAAMQTWKRPDRPGGRYRQQYYYRCPNHACRGQAVEPGWLPATTAIDWTIPGTRIGDRDKPLAEKTRRRIAAGIARYWHPVHLEAAGHTYDAADPKHAAYGDPSGYYRAWSTGDVLKTLHTIESKALAIPVEGRDGKDPRIMTEPLRTQTTRLETAMVTPMVVPSGGTWNEDARPAGEPLCTLVTRDACGLLQPFIAELRGGGSTARSTADPMATVTAAGNHHGLVTPYYGTAQTAHPTTDALGTLTTRDRYALVHRHNTGGAEMLTPAGEVMRTLTTGGHQSILTPGDMAAAEAQVDDCLFRMLEPHEVAAGNAVTPPAARDLIAAVVASLSRHDDVAPGERSTA